MNNKIAIALTIILIGIIGFFTLNKYIYTVEQGNNMENTASSTSATSVKVTPISHATMVLNLGGQVIYIDPVGGKGAFVSQPAPDLILITDIHFDHMDAPTLKAVAKDDTVIVVPQAVNDQLPKDLPGTVAIMKNGEKGTQKGVEITAIPMYNIPELPQAFHTKGRGNGYVISGEGKRVYIAGDTSSTPEMKALQNIDVAFIPMNLPYTMSVEEAAEGVLVFKPKVVHPYHYRGPASPSASDRPSRDGSLGGPDGLADINKFKQLVEAGDSNIRVELLNFYPGSQ